MPLYRCPDKKRLIIKHVDTNGDKHCYYSYRFKFPPLYFG